MDDNAYHCTGSIISPSLDRARGRPGKAGTHGASSIPRRRPRATGCGGSAASASRPRPAASPRRPSGPCSASPRSRSRSRRSSWSSRPSCSSAGAPRSSSRPTARPSTSWPGRWSRPSTRSPPRSTPAATGSSPAGSTSPPASRRSSTSCPRPSSEYSAAYPGIELRLQNVTGRDGLKMLRSDAVDFAVGSMIEVPEDISYLPTFRYDPMLITARDHPLAAKPKVTIKDVAAVSPDPAPAAPDHLARRRLRVPQVRPELPGGPRGRRLGGHQALRRPRPGHLDRHQRLPDAARRTWPRSRSIATFPSAPTASSSSRASSPPPRPRGSSRCSRPRPRQASSPSPNGRPEAEVHPAGQACGRVNGRWTR